MGIVYLQQRDLAKDQQVAQKEFSKVIMEKIKDPRVKWGWGWRTGCKAAQSWELRE